jgi:glycosyltransferase involved in cell wall biosynthesis
MCIVSPTYNNVDHDRFMWTLESILQQNYTNWRMVFIDDASSDKTSEKIAAHLKWRNISEDKVTVVRSTVNRKPMANIFYGSQKYCRLGEIQYVIDGDDELVGRQVFKVMNAVYQKNKFITVYSSHIIASGTMDNPFHYLGISKDYWQQDI